MKRKIVFDDGVVQVTEPDPTPEELVPIRARQINAEAYLRIVAIAPEYKQRNMLAKGLALLNKGKENWTPLEAAVVADLEATWATIDAIRAASDEAIETGSDPVWPE